MPFTFSHPAATIPFARTRLVLSALVVGSIMPDFWYFVTLTGQERDAHTFPGVVVFTFPASCAVFVLFHQLLKWPLLSLMPVRLQRRLIPLARRSWWSPPSQLFLVAFSIAIGIVTHLAWDSFTHPDGLVCTLWPGMTRPLFYIGRTAIPPYKLAQHMSTVIGAAVIAVFFARWYSAAHCVSDVVRRLFPRKMTATVVVCGAFITTMAGIIRGIELVGNAHALSALRNFAVGFAVTSISTGFVLLVVYSILWHCVRPDRTSGTPAKTLSTVSSN